MLTMRLQKKHQASCTNGLQSTPITYFLGQFIMKVKSRKMAIKTETESSNIVTVIIVFVICSSHYHNSGVFYSSFVLYDVVFSCRWLESPGTVRVLLLLSRILYVHSSKGRFPLPEFTGRVHWPSWRPENSGAFFDTRQLGPWTRVVETGRPCTRVVETDLYNS